MTSTPLTTPEEAHLFLNSMRHQQHKRDGVSHEPPKNLSADGMNAWFLQQRQHQQQMKQRRREAENILRQYNGAGFYARTSPRSEVGTSSSVSLPDAVSKYMLYSPDHTAATGASFAALQEQTSMGSPSVNGLMNPHKNSMRKFIYPGIGSKGSSSSEDCGEEKKESHEDVAPIMTASSLPHTTTHGFGSNITPNNSFHGTSHKNPAFGGGFLSPPPPAGLSTNTATPGPKTAARLRRESNISNKMSQASSRKSIEPKKAAVPETVWREFISPAHDRFQPAAGRYHLYCSYACPGSHRALIVRALKGLQNVISVTYLHPVWRLTNAEDTSDKHRGWVFGDPNGKPFGNTINKGGPFPPAFPENDPDPTMNAFSIRELYESVNDTSGKYTIPLLYDKKLQTIVNNESSDIAYMFNSCFNEFCDNPELDLYTEQDATLTEVSEWLSPLMIHGVYRCGFAKTQMAYDRAINDLCAAFDRADDTLEQQRFLTGDTLTDVDIRLFVTLLRFDEVYTTYFKANARLVMLTPSLLNFCRDIYQMPGVAETCNMEHIKAHFFASHAEWNKYSVIPRGLGFVELLDMPHDRDMFSNNSQALMPSGNDEWDLQNQTD